MPIFEPRDVAPPKPYSAMPVEEYLRRRLFIDLADGGEVKSFEEKSLNKKGYETEGLSKKEIFDLYDSVMGTFSKRYKKGGVSSLFKKRKRYANGGIASMFRERPGYAEGGRLGFAIDDSNELAQQKFNDYLKEQTGYENVEDFFQDPIYMKYNPEGTDQQTGSFYQTPAATQAAIDSINLENYKPYGYEDRPFKFSFDEDPDYFYRKEYEYDTRTGGSEVKNKIPFTSEEKQRYIKSDLEQELYNQSLLDPYRSGFIYNRLPKIEGSKFFLDQLKNLQGRDSDFADVIEKGNYIDLLEDNLRGMYDVGEYQKLQETLDPNFSKYVPDAAKRNKQFNPDSGDIFASSISSPGSYDSTGNYVNKYVENLYPYLSEAELNIINKSQNLPSYLTGYAQQLIEEAKNRRGEAQRNRPEGESYIPIDPNTGRKINETFITNQIPTVDPFSGQPVSAQDQMAFTQPQPEIFPTSNNIVNTLNVGSSDPLTNILGSQVGNLSYSEMNALRNNPNAFLENPFLQALRTGVQLASPGKVISDVGEGLSTIYHGTVDPSKAFMGSKFFATPDYQTALQYARQGALRGTQFGGDIVGNVLEATVPTNQVQDLLKRGLTGTREIVLDPQAAQKLFLQGSGDLVETGSLMSRLGRKAFQALPVVGAGLAGLDAYQRFGQGDYIGSALGAASAIPVLGLPATAAQVAYDIYNQSQNSPVVGFNQVQDPRTMMAYGGRVSMSNGGLTNTIPPDRGPSSQGVESLFKKR